MAYTTVPPKLGGPFIAYNCRARLRVLSTVMSCPPSNNNSLLLRFVSTARYSIASFLARNFALEKRRSRRDEGGVSVARS